MFSKRNREILACLYHSIDGPAPKTEPVIPRILQESMIACGDWDMNKGFKVIVK
jgi:hypothetical protein